MTEFVLGRKKLALVQTEITKEGTFMINTSDHHQGATEVFW